MPSDSTSLTELQLLILRLVSEHDGRWTLYQLDRAISNGPNPFVGPFASQTNELESAGLIETRPNSIRPGMPFLCVSDAGRAVLGSLPAEPLKASSGEALVEMSENDYNGFLIALGEEFSTALQIDRELDICSQDAYEVWLRAFGQRPTPKALACLDSVGLERLRTEFQTYLEIAGLTVDRIEQAVARTLFRWPPELK